MSRVVSIATEVPAHRLTQEQLITRYAEMRGNDSRAMSHIPIFKHSGVETRYLTFPEEYYLSRHSFERRNRDFVEEAVRLGERAIRACLGGRTECPRPVDHFVTVTTTGLATPSLETMLIQRVGLALDVTRTPIFGTGCAGGVVGLARAAEMLRANASHSVLLLSVELCGQTFDPEDRSKLGSVALSLFGDGAVAVLLAGDRMDATGPRYVASKSVLIPDSHDIMGWDFTNDGMRLVLSPKLPRVARSLTAGIVRPFLAGHGLSQDDVKFWIVHPGSSRVLDAIQHSLELSPEQLRWSRDSLRRFGNLSSASVLFVLNDVMKNGGAQPGDHGLVLAMGPGFAVELVLLRW